MRVLLTGSTGFLGRHLARELLARGGLVESWSRALEGPPGCLHRRLDLLTPGTCPPIAPGTDAVVHLAGHAVPGARWSAALAAENLALAQAAARATARHAPAARFVFLSSAHVYAPSPGRLRESDPLGPTGDYGRSKLACEQWLSAGSGLADLLVVRSFSQVGPGMATGLFVPDLLAAAARGEGPIQLAGPDAERDLLDVRDGARALADLLLAPTRPGEAVNLCSGRVHLLSGFARLLLDALGVERALVFQPGRGTRALGDDTRLRALTAWRPELELAQTAAWIAAASRTDADRKRA